MGRCVERRVDRLVGCWCELIDGIKVERLII